MSDIESIEQMLSCPIDEDIRDILEQEFFKMIDSVPVSQLDTHLDWLEEYEERRLRDYELAHI